MASPVVSLTCAIGIFIGKKRTSNPFAAYKNPVLVAIGAPLPIKTRVLVAIGTPLPIKTRVLVAAYDFATL